jgi:hypothetical protein
MMFDEGNILLLQLVFDDMMHWSFGDNGRPPCVSCARVAAGCCSAGGTP